MLSVICHYGRVQTLECAMYTNTEMIIPWQVCSKYVQLSYQKTFFTNPILRLLAERYIKYSVSFWEPHHITWNSDVSHTPITKTKTCWSMTWLYTRGLFVKIEIFYYVLFDWCCCEVMYMTGCRLETYFYAVYCTVCHSWDLLKRDGHSKLFGT